MTGRRLNHTFRDNSLASFFSPRTMFAAWGLFPLYGALTFALAGGSYFVLHTAGGPELGWTAQERVPGYEGYANNRLQPYQSTKMYSPHKGEFFTEHWNKLVR
ncbi:hypothetical protein HDV03_005544 [Kappamyces sp. JEL0829]|nr:hypothetical protein HDV03_005544 [Kappamyces sp. JEL0829]KAJ3368939.1 hypothetical protein HDU91_000200 [Kappamyces sp. JEL0680]